MRMRMDHFTYPTSESARISRDVYLAEASRRSYQVYCQRVHKGLWKPAAHLSIVCNALDDVIAGTCKRLMIFMPPRHGKSMSTTETFPSYFLGKYPEKRVIEVSYGSELAERFGRYNRQKIEEFGPQIFGVSISHTNASKTDWGIEGTRGGMLSAGLGGSITGHGADLIIIDDPVKNRQEAESPTYRNRIWDEYQNTIGTRLHPGGSIIIILTRWHEDDLAGRLLNPEYCDPEDWRIISLPAACESKNDLLGREIGAPLWPDHGFDTEWLQRTKKAVGTYAWNSLYQQRPAPIEGSIIKRDWWRFYAPDTLPEEFDSLIQSWDCTFKDNDDNDYVVGQVWGRKGAALYLLDQIRDRMTFTRTVRSVESMTEKYPDAWAKLIEDKANGSAVIDTLRRSIPGMRGINPQGSKIARLHAVSPLIEAGDVYLPAPSMAPWVRDFVEEFASFPNGKNDDQVDATSQALHYLNTRSMQIDQYTRQEE